MSRDQEWRPGSARQVRYDRPELQHPAGGSRGELRGLPQPFSDTQLSKGPEFAEDRQGKPLGRLEVVVDRPGRPLARPDLAAGRSGRHSGSPGLPDPALGKMRTQRRPLSNGQANFSTGQASGSPALPDPALGNLGRPLGSPALSILAKGRSVAPVVDVSQRQEPQHKDPASLRDRPSRSVSYDPAASRSASPADRNGYQHDRPLQEPGLSRLGGQRPNRRPLAPVELPPVLPARAARLHQVQKPTLLRSIPF